MHDQQEMTDVHFSLPTILP